MGDPLQDILHAGDGNAVAQRPVPGGIRRAFNVRPAVREALEPLAFQRRQPADELPIS